jgi:hypothetical protein
LANEPKENGAPAGRRALPAAFAANKWRPGQSGNPTGNKGALYQECLRLSRTASPEAIRRLIELMGDEDPRVSVVACNAILDRAWGKPRETPPTEKPEAPPNFSNLSDEQLAQYREIVATLREGGPTEDQDDAEG